MSDRLLDAIFRHQVYLEGVKAYFTYKFYGTLKKLARVVSAELGLVQYSNLGELSRPELLKLVSAIGKAQGSTLNTYQEALLGDLRELVEADSHLAQEILGTITGKNISLDEDELWDIVLDEPIPASGKFLEDSIESFLGTVKNLIVASIQYGYANNITPASTIRAIVGNQSNRYADGLFAKLLNQANGLLGTAVQHVSSNVQSAAGAQVEDEYVWASVLDEHTTEICESRNGIVYKVGEGPLPPAHYGCRSRTLPTAGETIKLPSFGDWFNTQTKEFQDDVRNLTASGAARAMALKPLTITQFVEKLNLIIGEQSA